MSAISIPRKKGKAIVDLANWFVTGQLGPRHSSNGRVSVGTTAPPRRLNASVAKSVLQRFGIGTADVIHALPKSQVQRLTFSPSLTGTIAVFVDDHVSHLCHIVLPVLRLLLAQSGRCRLAFILVDSIVRRIPRLFSGLFSACLLCVPLAASAQPLLISEFRVRGPNGANDEFVRIYNNSGANHTVAAISGTGYGLAASNGVTRCSIPNGTVIPARGSYLCVNSVGYSLASYPAGNGTTATGDATYTAEIPDNAGIALFNNNTGGASYSLANRVDAVGSTSEANTLYREGTGYPALTPFSIDYSFTRKPTGGCTGSGGGTNCNTVTLIKTTPGPTSAQAVDTNNNATDFIFVDTNGTSAGAGQRLGAPGPENLSSPISRDGSALATSRLDSCSNFDKPPNQVRDLTSTPALQLDVWHARHPADVHQHDRRPRHAAAVPHPRHHDIPLDLRCG